MLSLPLQVAPWPTTALHATLRAPALPTLPYGGTATTPGTPMPTSWAPAAAPAPGEEQLGWACVDVHHVTAFAHACPGPAAYPSIAG